LVSWHVGQLTWALSFSSSLLLHRKCSWFSWRSSMSVTWQSCCLRVGQRAWETGLAGDLPGVLTTIPMLVGHVGRRGRMAGLMTVVGSRWWCGRVSWWWEQLCSGVVMGRGGGGKQDADVADGPSIADLGNHGPSSRGAGIWCNYFLFYKCLCGSVG